MRQRCTPRGRGRRRVVGRLVARGRLLAALLLVTLTAAATSLAVPDGAHAYTYDYNMYINWWDQSWQSRGVAHNYSYIRMSTSSAYPYLCVKLTRTSNGANYGDVYCNNYQTGHHYAGDTGTHSWGKASNSAVSQNYPYHEEW